MKLAEEKDKTFQSNIAQQNSTKFGIGDASVIIEILRNRLYENKIQTLTQEYISNARDAHREINQTRPIEITFPSALSLELIIRDFGIGITPDRMESVFVLYGASTKRDSNKQTGGFGIGSKSAWSYTDSFTINTYIDGIQRTYVAHIGESKNGQLDLISETETEEDNGTSVSVSIKARDISDFHRAIVRATMFWDTKEYPVFKGVFDQANLKESRKVGLSRFMNSNISGVTPNSFAASGHNNITLIVDGIPYPMPSNSRCVEPGNLKIMCNTYYLNVFIPNGLVQVSASREKIDDSEVSQKAIKEIFIAAIAEFGKAKKEWEDSIVDTQSLMNSLDRSSGFRLSTEKSFDFVTLTGGGFHLQVVKKVNNQTTENLFQTRSIDRESSRLNEFNLNSKNRYYLLKKGTVSIKSIQFWLENDSPIDGVELVTILGHKRTESVNDEGETVFSWKKNEDLVNELVESLNRIGFKNIEDFIPAKPKFAKSERVVGNIYKVKAWDGDRLMPISDIKDWEQTKPWIYFVGLQREYEYSRFKSFYRTMEEMKEIEYGFRVTERYEKHIKSDPRFIEWKEFTKSWQPSEDLCLNAARHDWMREGHGYNNNFDNTMHSVRVNLKNKNHVIYKFSEIYYKTEDSNIHGELGSQVRSSSIYKDLMKDFKNISDFVSKHLSLIPSDTRQNQHVEEYIQWALDKAGPCEIKLNTKIKGIKE